MNKDEANRFLLKLSNATKTFIQSRTLLESNLFPVRAYMAVGLYNLFENEYDLLRKVINKKKPEKLGAECKTVNSEINQKTQFSTIVGYLVGREQVIEDGNIDEYGDKEYDAEKIMFLLDYWTRFSKAYRNDGQILVNDSQGAISILNKRDVKRFNDDLLDNDAKNSENLLKLAAVIQSYLYLLNYESRGGVFNHGPYQVDDELLVFREFIHLQKNTYKTTLNDDFHYKNITMTLRLRDVDVNLNEVGTLFVDPINYADKITGFNIYSSNSDPKPINVDDINKVSNLLRNRILYLYRDINRWDRRDKIIAGALQYSDLTCYAKAANIDYRHGLSKGVEERYLPKMMRQVTHEFMNKFAETGKLFTLIE